jgi:hypothetical protein
MRARLVFAATLVLIAGLVSGTVLYLTAPEEVEAGAYVIIGDTAYAVDPASSKTYRRDLERFGGKASLLFDDFDRWFAALWRGKRLGITIASLGAGAAALLFFLARKAPPD